MTPHKSEFRIDCLIVGALETNCYVVSDKVTAEGIVIDPGANPELILKLIKRKNLNITGIINTHGHIDHIGANAELKRATGAKIMIHPDDAPLLANPELNGAWWLGIPFLPLTPDVLIENSATISVGSLSLTAWHTPGHSPGSVVLFTDGLLFSGDLLFKDGVGRWDLPGGDEEQLLSSLQRVLQLPDATKVFPGHGPATTIGYEKINNTYIQNM